LEVAVGFDNILPPNIGSISAAFVQITNSIKAETTITLR